MQTLDQDNHNRIYPPDSQQAAVKEQQTRKDHTFFQKSGRRTYLPGWLPPHTFAASPLPAPWNRPLPGYLAAVLAPTGLFAALRLVLQNWPTFHFVSAFPLILVLLIACGWGLVPALVATLWGGCLFLLFPLLPNRALSITEPVDLVSLLLYVGAGLIMSWIIDWLVHARVKAETISNQFEATFEAISDGFSIYDREGKILRINSAGRDIFAMHEQPEYVNLPLSERLAKLQLRDMQGEPLPSELWPQSRILRGEVLRGPRTMSMIARALDGRDVYVTVSGAPILDEKGQIQGAVCITRNETEQRMLERRTHEALQALLHMAEELVKLPTQEGQSLPREISPAGARAHSIALYLAELIRSILGCVRVSITMIDPRTGVADSSAAVGLSPQQEQQWKARQPGFILSELFAGTDVDRHLHANEVVAVDLRQPSWQGVPNPYGITTMLLAPMNIGGRLIGVLALDHGGQVHIYTREEQQLAKAVAEMAALVLERERLFQERAEVRASELSLRAANRLMDDFIGIAGHELRTPLTTIKASVQLAQRNLQRFAQIESPPTREEHKQRLQQIEQLLTRAEQQINMQNRLIHDLLDVSRIQRNKLELHLEPIDIVKLVDTVVENQRLLEPERVLRLENRCTGPILVEGDADRLGQVVSNLLSNALKYSEVDEPVEVTLDADARDIHVRVRDYGPGLPFEDQQRIWERFYRVPGIEARSGSGIGLGLGLHISRTLIERHGGEIGVESAPGQGSVFWFTLPRTGA